MLNFIALDLSLKDMILIIADEKHVFFRKKSRLDKNKAGTLLKNLKKGMLASQIEFEDIGYIFSTIGPGNFNGIRISLSTVRGLVLGTKIVAAGISTMECIARSVSTEKNIGVILKAYPEHIYFQLFDNNYAAITQPELKNIKNKINIPVKLENMILVGDQCDIFSKQIGFRGKTITLESPTSFGLLNAVKGSISKNVFLPPSPLYLRPARATEPTNWKNSPIIS